MTGAASRRTVAAGALAASLLLSGAAPPSEIGVSSPGSVPQEVGSAMLRSLPAVTVAVTSRGGTTARYSGPRLWDVLGRAGAVGGKPDDRLHEMVAVFGVDGYAAPLALAEIDPAFEGKDVILALARDDVPLERPRLVIPGDRHPGRDVRDVVSIRVER